MKNTTLATILALSVLATPAVSFGATKHIGPCYAYLGYESKGVDEIKQVNCIEWGSSARHSREEAEQDRNKHLQEKAKAGTNTVIVPIEKQAEVQVKIEEVVKKELVSRDIQKQKEEDAQAKEIAELTAILQSLILQLAELKAQLGYNL